MTDEREELIEVRDRLDAELAELGAEIEDVQEWIDTIDDDLAGTISDRDEATEAFLPDDRLPATVSNETRGEIASHLDTLGERRDVRSEEVAKKTDELKAQRKTAVDARDDIEEIEAVVDDLAERTNEAEAFVDDARDELDAARSQFTDDLVMLAEQLSPFDVDLSDGMLDAVIEDRIPERTSEMQSSIESARERVEELSTHTSELAADRDRLQSIEGGGICPTCKQNVGPEQTGSEAKVIAEELNHAERQLGEAKEERDELIERREELLDLREQAIALRTFRSETMAAAAGRVEDRQENFEDMQADLEEERTELAESTAERDDADAAIERLETEIAELEADIDTLEESAAQGERCLETFQVLDELRGQRAERVEKRTELQANYEEKKAERASLDAEIEALADDE